jgi:hypothetical protein
MMNTATLQTLIRHHREQPIRPGFDDDGKAVWLAILQKLDELVQPVAVEVDAVMKNQQLSDQGKRDMLMGIGPRVVGNFVNMGTVLNQADHAKARLEKVLFSEITKKPSGNEVVTFLREDAIRRTTGKAGAGTAFLKALEADDTESARALLDWPGGSPITEDIKRRGEEAYAQRTNPDAWEKLQYIEFLRENLAALAASVAQWLIGLGASAESVQKSVKAQN